MTGCFDSAEFYAAFTEKQEEDQNGLILEVCESCAQYWREHKEEIVKIVPMKKQTITRADLTFEKNIRGAWVVSALVVGYWVSCQYYGYTKKQAGDKFLAEIQRQKTAYDRVMAN